jgi:hypothetical protein
MVFKHAIAPDLPVLKEHIGMPMISAEKMIWACCPTVAGDHQQAHHAQWPDFLRQTREVSTVVNAVAVGH